MKQSTSADYINRAHFVCGKNKQRLRDIDLSIAEAVPPNMNTP